jgi:hypothetical protein
MYAGCVWYKLMRSALANCIQLPLNGRTGYAKADSRHILADYLSATDSLSEGLRVFRTHTGKYGYTSLGGTVAIDPLFDMACPFRNGLAMVVKGRKAGFLKREGSFKIKPQFTFADNFISGLAVVAKASKWGFIDMQGQAVIPCIFDHATSFAEGLGRIMKDGKYGFVNSVGLKIIPSIYDDASMEYSEGVTAVCLKKNLDTLDTLELLLLLQNLLKHHHFLMA